MRSYIKKIILVVATLAIVLGLTTITYAALDTGVGAVDSNINLSSKGPIAVATQVINILMGLLGVIALGLILWSGYIWMTAGGNEEKITQAKKILKNASIGLILILSAWGIAYFVLTRLVGDTGGSGFGGNGCSNGTVVSCGCGGAQTCNSGTWGPCLGSSCDPGAGEVSCDGKPALGGCQADENICGPDYQCNADTCLCENKKGLGESCNTNASGDKCSADDNLCGPYLKCSPDSCLCEGPPVITNISPTGGFCSNDQDRGCNNNEDCASGGRCDLSAPNGAANNFLTIYGYNFGTTADLFQNILTNVDFEEGTPGSVPRDWSTARQQNSGVGISQEEARSGSQSMKMEQSANLSYPGSCTQAICTNLSGCSWSTVNRTCTFNTTDAAHLTAPAVYREGETLVWGNSNNIMWAKLSYNLAPLNFQLGETYAIRFYYKGYSNSAVSVMVGSSLGYTTQCADYGYYPALKSGYTWDGAKVIPTPPDNEDPCNPSFGKTCAEQSNYCCVQAPYQKKCYNALVLPAIPSGATDDWTMYSYTFQYTPEMASWLDKNGNKMIEFGLSIGYNSTGARPTSFYVDDFTVTKILTNGQVSFLGENAGQTQLANFPKLLNANCVSYWTDRQITIAVPSGAMSGPIMVRREATGDNNYDITNDDTGPKIPDFVRNNIYRPGLCQISPDQGQLGDKVSYQGINLKNSVAYFGAYNSAFRGINSSFSADNLSGQTLAPNIVPGQTTTFVERTLSGINQKSNTLKFVKTKDPEMGPYISGFSPSSGPAGQYLTITGKGFGNLRGSRQVFIGNQEASYEFPEVCANSTWSDSQIIVKIPNGLSAGAQQIRINLGDTVINSDLLTPNNTFRFDPTDSLKTSLCKIDPERGQLGDPVTLWGEYFGDSNTKGLVVFNRGINTSSPITKDGKADKIVTAVPVSDTGVPAITGPVRVLKNSAWGNELNFTVGKCTANSECSASSPVCCPSGTYKSGSCSENLLGCYFQVPNSVYETSFNTGLAGATPTETFDNCGAMATFFNACQIGQFCPNSPGKCSPFDGTTPEVVGTCGQGLQPCGDISYCQTNDCLYNQATDTCRAGSCLLGQSFTYYLGGEAYTGETSCRSYTNEAGQTSFVKHLAVKTSCPDGWKSAGNGYCVGDVPFSCSSCEAGFKCVADDYQQDDLGVCESVKLCRGGAYCGLNPKQPGQLACLGQAPKSCDCCCEIGQDARDCCAPLKCGGTCGSDTTDDGSGFGFCTGCTDAGSTTAERDAACNCSSTSGKFCDITKPSGACVDCGALDEAGCQAHSTQCCFDEASQTCQGGDGTQLANGRCAYYDCQADNKAVCDTTPATTGRFKNLTTCQDTCPKDPQTVCDLAKNATDCSRYGACCFDAKTQKCINGTDKIISGNDKINYCGYYNCNLATKECSTEAVINGDYLGLAKCRDVCKQGPSQPGNTCASSSIDSCDTSICSSPYKCLGDGSGGLDCGTCCCTPGEKSGDLTCLADKGSCSGGDRGLFCGCKADNECGAGIGCGTDTCCHARPQVVDILPANDQDKVCRNAQVKIEFNESMDLNTLPDNILLIEEKNYGSGVCADGTLVASGGPDTRSLVAKIIDQVKVWLGRTPSALAAFPVPGKLYCTVPANLSFEAAYYNNQQSTNVYIQPQRLLAASTNHFVLVKGDEASDSNSGVLNVYGVGMQTGGSASFNGQTYANVRLSSFSTLSDVASRNGLCAVSYVDVTPDSILINVSDNDTSDDNPGSSSFDTKNDSDRALYAKAYSSDQQIIQPVPGYSWNWVWRVDDEGVVQSVPLTGLNAHQKVVRGVTGVTDQSTNVSVSVDMSNIKDNISTEGNGENDSTEVYVFLCANPWPTVRNGLWQPWYDKCINRDGQIVPGCSNYNYKFYYCRDSGEPGTADDLPAVVDPALIMGSSGGFVCSTDNSPCSSVGSACASGGTCIWSVLKESYFFREAAPMAGEIWDIKSTGAGGEVQISWTSPLNMEAPITSFKLYYGPSSGNARSFVTTIAANSGACGTDNGKRTCSYTVGNLQNNEKYSFRVTALTDKLTESPLSGAREVIPTDTTPPMIPQGLEADLSGTQLTLSWKANNDDTLNYRLFHGIFPGKKAAESFDSQDRATKMTLDVSNYQVGSHYFYISAIDMSGNVSLTSPEIMVTITKK